MTTDAVSNHVAKATLERWSTLAPAGYRIVAVPRLIVPAHDVVIELWDDCFVAGSPDIDETLLGYGVTPIGALCEHERKNFYVLHDLAAAYSGFNAAGASPTVAPAKTRRARRRKSLAALHAEMARGPVA